MSIKCNTVQCWKFFYTTVWKFLVKCIFRAIILLTVLFCVQVAFATSGCCSWHGGEDHCDTSANQIVCHDGSYSPSCTCDSNSADDDDSNQSNNDDHTDDNDDSSNN